MVPPITIEYARAIVGAPRAGEEPLLADLYLPEATAPHPLAVLVHGGGFFEGSRIDVGMVRMCESLALSGIAALSIDYRLRDQLPVPSDRVAGLAPLLAGFSPAAVTAADDLLSALDWAKARIDEGLFAPDGVVLAGSSAGAATVNHVAYVLQGSSPVPLAGVVSLWGGSFAPIPVSDSALPPLLTMHGSADTVVPMSASEALGARVRELGGDVEHHVLVGGGHGHENSRIWEHEVRPGALAFDVAIDWIAGRLIPHGGN